MANDPDNMPGRRRRPPPPIIDLKASEVPSDASPARTEADDAPPSPGSPSPERSPEPAPSDEAVKPEASPAAPTADEPSAAPSEGVTSTEKRATQDETVDQATVTEAAPAKEAAGFSVGALPTPSLIAGAAAGAIVALLIVVVVWAAGGMSPSQDQMSDARLADRLSTMERQVRDLAQRVTASQPARSDISGLTSRLAAVEKDLAQLQTSGQDLAARLAKVETNPGASTPSDKSAIERTQAMDAALASLKRDVASLNERVAAAVAAAAKAQQTAAARPDTTPVPQNVIDPLAQRIDGLEQTTKSFETKLAKLEDSFAKAARANDAAIRVALIATVLRDAVERGVPYAEMLAALKTMMPKAEALAPLEPFAADGVPKASVLARELSDVLPAMRTAAAPTPPADAGLMDRLRESAARLVRVRPVGEVEGSDPSAIIARLAAAAQDGDIARAVREIDQLPENVRQPAENWIKKARARMAAIAAARRLVTDTIAGLAKSAS